MIIKLVDYKIRTVRKKRKIRLLAPKKKVDMTFFKQQKKGSYFNEVVYSEFKSINFSLQIDELTYFRYLPILTFKLLKFMLKIIKKSL